MSNEARIEIYGQGGPCDRSRVEVSHAMPAIVGGFITANEWESMCNRLDEALEAVQAVKSLQFAVMCISITLVSIFFIMGIVSINLWDTDTNFEAWSIFFVLMGSIIFFGALGTALFLKKRTFEARNTLKRVCDEVSNSYPQISFQVRFENVFFGGRSGQNLQAQTYNYILVTVAMTAMPSKPVAGQFVGVTQQVFTPVTPQMVGGGGMSTADTSLAGGKSAVDRLQDLEAIKGLISVEEYNRKRTEILESV